jgi:putative PIN family toxin of toxin-antitoxin system
MRQRLVIDTNVFVSRLLKPISSPGSAVRRAIDHHQILVSDATMHELAKVLAQPKLTRYITVQESQTLIRALGTVAEIIAIIQPVDACRDPRDNTFLEVAVNGTADVIITGDADLRALHPFRGIAIMSPNQWISAAEESAKT